MGIYNFSAEKTVAEVRDMYLKLYQRGYISEDRVKAIVKRFAEEKQRVREGTLYITVII